MKIKHCILVLLLVICSAAEIAAQSQMVSWTVWEPSSCILTLKAGYKGSAGTPGVSSGNIWLCDETGDGWQKRKYGNDYLTYYQYHTSEPGIGEGIYTKVKKFVVDPSYKNYPTTSINCFFRDMLALEEVTGLENMVLSNLYNYPDNPYNQGGLSGCFRNCPNLKAVSGIETWKADNITNFNDMFGLCRNLECIDLGSLHPIMAVNMDNMFYGCENLRQIWVGDGWTTNGCVGNNMFYNCPKLFRWTSDYLTAAKASGTNGGYLLLRTKEKTPYAVFSGNRLTFYYDYHYSSKILEYGYGYYYTIPELVTYQEQVYMQRPDWLAPHKKDIVYAVFDDSFNSYSPPACYAWFYECENLKSVKNCQFPTTSTIYATDMFYGCKSLDLSTSDVQLTLSNCVSFAGMFYNCQSLRAIPPSIKFTSAKNMKSAFANCASLTSAEISIGSSITNADKLFDACRGLKMVVIRLSAATASLATAEKMFYNCDNLVRIYVSATDYQSGYDAATDTYNPEGFSCSDLLVFGDKTNTADMFYNCSKLGSTRGTNYSPSNPDKTYARIDKGSSAPGYFSQLEVPYYTYSNGKMETSGKFNITNTSYFSKKPQARTGYTFRGWKKFGMSNVPIPEKEVSVYKDSYSEYVLVATWAKHITDASITLSSDTYTGTVVPLVVTLDGVALKDQVDYLADKRIVTPGSYTVTVRGTDKYADSKTVTLYLAKAEATVYPSGQLSKGYGEEDPELTYKVEGLKGKDQITGTLVRQEGEDVGTYGIIKESGFTHDCYSVSYIPVGFQILTRHIKVTPGNLSKTYGDSDPELTYTVEEDGLINDDALNGSLSRAQGENVGEYAIQQGTLSNSNYTIDLVPAKFSITPKPASVQANAITKEYGTADPELTYTADGILTGDKLLGSLVRQEGEEIGEYSISQGSLENSNYSITFAGAKFVITKKALTAPTIELKSNYCLLNGNNVAEPGVKVYDGVTPLVEDVDYTVSYADNTKVGTASVTITQKTDGHYTFDPITKDFEIIDKTDACAINYITDGKIEKTDYCANGQNIPFPVIVKEGYTIEGVFKDEDLHDAWDFANDVIDGNISLYIKWRVNTHTVSFKLDGVPFGKNITQDYGTEITYPEPEEKEGYTFGGWKPAPATMPDYDFTAEGTYKKNVHHITYMLDGKEYQTINVEYGNGIAILDAPAGIIGFTFSGWTPSALPATMPDKYITITGNMLANKHKLVFNANGEAVKTVEDVAFGTDITTLLPAKDYCQYVYSQPPTGNLMPDYDITVEGRFDANKHNITYMLNGEIYATVEVEAGSAISLFENLTLEGYTFSGWQSDYATMPDKDITVDGTFAPNKYKLTFNDNGAEVSSVEVLFGTSIENLIPTREGSTYIADIPLPETMPSSDLVVDGAFELCIYHLVLYIDNEEYLVYQIPYGAEIPSLDIPVRLGCSFSGWSETPTTMPSHDITISGTFTQNGNGNNSTPVSSLTDAPSIKVWAYNRTIYIETAPDSQYKIIDLQGRVLTTSTTKSSHDEINLSHSGLLIVIVNGHSFKVSAQ